MYFSTTGAQFVFMFNIVYHLPNLTPFQIMDDTPITLPIMATLLGNDGTYSLKPMKDAWQMTTSIYYSFIVYIFCELHCCGYCYRTIT